MFLCLKLIVKNKFLKFVSYGVFFCFFIFIAFNLFFEKEAEYFFDSFVSNEGSERGDFYECLEFVKGYSTDRMGCYEFYDESFEMLYPYDVSVSDLEPTSLPPAVRQILFNVYEPLVFLDESLNYQPALAISWGILSDNIWEFNLRRGVVFHDGSVFDVNDVIFSLERAREFEGSDLKDLLSGVSDLEVVDDFTFRITTVEADPLLLYKLSRVLIVSEVMGENVNFVGTGPYIFESEKVDDYDVKFFDFSFNDSYWGKSPVFDSARIYIVSSKSRVSYFLNNAVDLLTFVPFDVISVLEDRGVKLSDVPSLEVQFLLFNFESDFFKDKLNREIFSLIIDQEFLVQKIGAFSRPVNQFVSNGVFGFSADIDQHVYDLEKAKVLLKDSNLQGATVQLHLPVGLDVLGEHVRMQFAEIGVNVVVSYLEGAKLMESFDEGKADLYFLGFKSETGDAADFYESIVYSSADFNIGNYVNDDVDNLIDLAAAEMDEVKRLEYLQDIMTVLDEDIFGVPLFEYSLLYASGDSVDFMPRIDGMVYFDDLTIEK